MRRVVVTGIGVVCPIGLGAGAFWANLIAGKVALRRIQAFDPGGFDCRIAGEAPPYRIADFVPKAYRKATKVMARDIELAVVAADGAFRDAGLTSKAHADTPTFDPARFGCNIGAGLINTDLAELAAGMDVSRGNADAGALDLRKWGAAGIGQLTPLWLLKYLPNMLACHVTIIHGLKGPSNTITCADASSHMAVGEALRTIQRGDADLAICGGAETKVQPMGLLRQCLLGRVTTTHNDAPEAALRPFDAQADGTVLGEGGGLLILEEYERAQARGARVYAEIVGFGASQDTYRITEPDPSGHSYANAISKAMADAEVSPQDVDLLVPHGLGIAAHDRAELAGLSLAFGRRLPSLAVAPIKAQMGSLGAGCGVDLAAAVLSLHHATIPPAVNTRHPIDGATLNVAPAARPAAIGAAVSSVYSLGGQNAAVVLRRLA